MADEEREKQIEDEELEDEEEYSPEAEQKRQVYLLLGLGVLLIGIVVFQVGRLRALQEEAEMGDYLASWNRLLWISPDETAILTGFQILDQPQQLLLAHRREQPEDQYIVWINHSLPEPNEMMVFSFLKAEDVLMGTDIIQILNAYSGLLHWMKDDEVRQVIPDGRGGYFDATDSDVNAMGILRFAPFRDFARSIHDPYRISVEQAMEETVYSSTDEVRYLEPQDRVLGVVNESLACAYPIKIMEKHNIVTDTLGDSRFSLVYDNLSSAGMAYKATEDDSDIDLSGLYLEGTSIPYDRSTQSLFSFLRSVAMTGPRKGESLSLKPVIQTTWEEWKRIYPDTLVLSPYLVEGATQQRDFYGHEIYRGSIPLGPEPRRGFYYEEEALIKPVVVEDEEFGLRTIWGRVNDDLPNKVWVIGIRGKTGQIAYPIPELARTDERKLTTQFEGRTIELHFDPESETGYALDEEGRPIPEATLSLWFAWVTAYPDTEIFWAEPETEMLEE